jgi:beta-phosphoglucomutase-like phosphatase (HAD superfamily)
VLQDQHLAAGLAEYAQGVGQAQQGSKGLLEKFQVAQGKPHPDIYLKALSELRASPEDAIAVEDSDHGIQSAAAAGMRVIHVPDIKQIDADTMARVHRKYASLLDFRDDMSLCQPAAPCSKVGG